MKISWKRVSSLLEEAQRRLRVADAPASPEELGSWVGDLRFRALYEGTLACRHYLAFGEWQSDLCDELVAQLHVRLMLALQLTSYGRKGAFGSLGQGDQRGRAPFHDDMEALEKCLIDFFLVAGLAGFDEKDVS